VVITPNPEGLLEADLSWTCPSNTTNGTPLTDLFEMRVYRDADLIYTDENPIIGGPGSYVDDTVPDNGMFDYYVAGYDIWGEGIPYIESVWVGEDVPAAVENLHCGQGTPGVLSAILTWDNPTTGLHGGAFNNPIDGYHIVRYPDMVPFELAGIATEYTDDTIPSAGVYYYAVQPYNIIGDGGIAESNYYWGPPSGILILEDFSTWLPAGWTTESTSGQINWVHGPSNNAGGTAPEAQFSWNPPTVSTQRLISPVINTTGALVLDLSFIHTLSEFGVVNQYLLIQTTCDGGATWNDVIAIPAYYYFNSVLEEITVATPDVGSDTFQIAWVYDGDSYNINYWYVDDVMLSVGDHGYIEGNVTLNGGNGNVEEVEVSAGDQTVHPDVNGDYSITLEAGTYDVMASLINYESDIIEGVVVDPGVIIAGIDFTLEWSYFPPEPPNNLNVDPETGFFTWSPPAAGSVVGYNVYLDSSFLDFTEESEWQYGNLTNGQTYLAGVSAVYDGGESDIVQLQFTYEGTGVLPNPQHITGIKTIYPNPFNPETTISFALSSEDAGAITLEVFNSRGQRVRLLVSEQLSAGQHEVFWNGEDDVGRKVASGIYYCRLRCREVLQTERMLLLK